MENLNINEELFELCYSIDTIAAEMYSHFSNSIRNKELKSFWKEMAKEEEEHMKFWQELLDLSKQNFIPQIFDNPQDVKKTLEEIQIKGKSLLLSSSKFRRKSDMFLTALSMEFMLLQPSFFTLFSFVKKVNNKITPEETYEAHLNKFLNALVKYRKDISELSFIGELLDSLLKENKKLSVQGKTDILTKIYNRMGFFLSIKPLAYLAKRHKFIIGVIMVDIDNLKKINDVFGHIAGDDVLNTIAGIIQRNIRASDVLGRYGGDEFIVFLSQIAPESIFDLCEKIRSKIEKSTIKIIPVTVSMGVCYGIIKAHPEEEIGMLIKKSDESLYEAKGSGKNRVVICNNENKGLNK